MAKEPVLREWHWRALACLYKAGDTGLKEYEGVFDLYRVGPRTLLRLLETEHCGFPLAEKIFRWRITPQGRSFYKQQWSHYRRLFPEVDALEPLDA